MNKTKLLYNVTFNMQDNRRHLEPTIPESAGEGENKTIKRVCLTDSVEHCLQAIAVGNRNIKKGANIKIRLIEKDKLDINKLLEPEYLFQSNLVPDALENQEFWYLDEIEFCVEEKEIEDFSYDFCIAWSCINLSDLTLPMPKGRGFLVAAESVSADQFISDRSYPKLGLCH